MIYEDEIIRIEREQNDLPWVKIFTQKPFRELSDCDENTRKWLFEVMMICEKEMLKFYKAHKINIASFANVLPLVHIHVIARFENDAFFPNSVWGEKLREADLNLASFDDFAKNLALAIKKHKEKKNLNF
ncbi:MAG: HIT family protein [Campylobacter sp.]|nr:HIT family protein [Campylobacter sp.]